MQTIKKGGFPINREGYRKVRSDKKRDIKPTIKITLKDAIYRLSYITKTPVKNVCESMIEYGCNNLAIINRLSNYFVRDIRFAETIFTGNLENPRYEKFESGPCSRITLRLSKTMYNKVTVIAYAMDLTPSRICAILLHDCMHDFKFLNSYTSQFLKGELSYNQMNELKEMLKYITKNVNVEASMASLLSMIVSEVVPVSEMIQDTVEDFIIHNWRENE